MPRAKRASDELYNARRRVRRMAERYVKAGNESLASTLREAARAGSGASLAELNRLYQGGTTTTRTTPAAAMQQDIGSQSRPKRPSDEVYNARRRLKRAAERMLRHAEQEQSDSARNVLKGYVKYLLQQANPLGRLTESARSAALERLGRLQEGVRGIETDGFRIKRRNAILMQQINAAGTEGAESSISERKKDVFWAATKGLWPKGSNVPRNERYDRILDHFYTEDTTDAKDFRAWLEEKKGTTAQESFGDLQLVYEYVTEEMNDPAEYDLPELPYETAMSLIITAM